MSGFDQAWLDLREPADHAARAPALLAAAGAVLAGRDRPLVVDLGCGTGSTLRALAPHLGGGERWRLVDHDPALLHAARERASSPSLETAEADLRDIDALPIESADLVTASALFDLVSQDWLARFASRLAASRTGLYAALTYDGATEFERPHPDDHRVVEAFNIHQVGDKGFGAALGPTAGEALEACLRERGFTLRVAQSPWRLEPGALQDAFVDGLVSAVGETGLVARADLATWHAFRRSVEGAGTCVVGHRDVLATPAS